MDLKFKEMLECAKAASENSYSPYSNFKVGAAVLFESGKIFSGTNVENSSYGLTACAERVAIDTAIASGERSKIVAIAVFSPNKKLCFPCGACRQVISEFVKDDDVKIILEDAGSEPRIYTLNDLLPNSFGM